MSDIVERLNEEGLGFGIGPALLCQEASAEITRLRGEVERLRAENSSLRHWAWGHIDCLLLYAAGSYPKDSHVKDAVEFCRILYPRKALRMDPPGGQLEGSSFHPARSTLTGAG